MREPSARSASRLPEKGLAPAAANLRPISPVTRTRRIHEGREPVLPENPKAGALTLFGKIRQAQWDELFSQAFLCAAWLRIPRLTPRPSMRKQLHDIHHARFSRNSQ